MNTLIIHFLIVDSAVRYKVDYSVLFYGLLFLYFVSIGNDSR